MDKAPASADEPALDDIAKRVNEEHEACRTAMCSVVEHAVRAGELLSSTI